VFLPCDYTEAKIESIFLHTYNWVCLFFFTPSSPTRTPVLHPAHPPTPTTTSLAQLRARNTNPQATKKVRDQIEECKTELSLSTKPYDSHNPRVIAEYLEAGDEERASFQQIFGACKLLMQLQSKGRWYSWKRGLIERLGPDVEGILEEVVQVCQAVRPVRRYD
jgi:hypothetical protein